MRRLVLAGLCCALTTSAAFAQPYGWFPGSTVLEAEKTGDRVVIVNLGDGSLVSDPDGWDFTDNSPGADPHVPGFSPDGRFVYLVNGGDGNAAQPDGHIAVFDTQDVIEGLESIALSPDPPIDVETILSEDEDAVEPIGLTMAPQGDRAYLVEGKDQKLHVFDVEFNGALTAVTTVPLGTQPSPLWLTSSGDTGYLCYFQGDVPTSPVVAVVDLRNDPPFISQEIALELPAQSETTFPFLYCSFPMPEGSSTTVVPFPAHQPADDSELYIFAGYAGFRVTGIVDNVINDPANVYRLTTATNTLSAPTTITPDADQVIFPPFIHAYVNESGVQQPDVRRGPVVDDVWAHVGGTTMMLNGSLNHTLAPDSSEQLVLNFGQLSPVRDSFYLGSLAAADAIAFGLGQTYLPVRNTSLVYRFDLGGPARGTAQNITPVLEVDRSLNLVLGFADNKVVIGASDTFFVSRLDVEEDSTSARDTQVVLYDSVALTSEVITLELVAGSYGQQPEAGAPAPNEAPTVEIVTPATDQVIPFAQTTFDFSGTATDPDANLQTVVYQVNGGTSQTASASQQSPGNYTWDFVAGGLNVGNNVVSVQAIDDEGADSSVESRIITREEDTNEQPIVNIVVPDGDRVIPFEQDTFAFSGTASDPDGTVAEVLFQVNGIEFEPTTGTLTWDFLATGLTVGNNLIEVVAIDDDDLASTPVTRVITRAEQGANVPPSVTIQVPAGDDSVPFAQTTYDFSGIANDPDGDVDLVEYQVNSGGFQPASGTLTWEFTAAGLNVGANLVEVRAVDNESAASTPTARVITRAAGPANQGPTVTIVTPPGNDTVPFGTTTYNFAGTAADPDGTVTEVRYRVNGGGFLVATGTTTWSFTATGLEVGPNLVEVKSVDDQGAESALAARIITREAEPAENEAPVAAITSPDDGTQIPADQTQINVTGTASDSDGVVETVLIRANDDEFTTATGTVSWTATVTGLEPGNNTIDVKAVDDDGAESDIVTINVFRTENDPGDIFVLTEFTDIWASLNETGDYQVAERMAFTGFRHNIPAGFATFAGDVNGDGLTDFINVTDEGQAWTAVNGGNLTLGNFILPVTRFNSDGWEFDANSGEMVFSGDFNGDGLADLAKLESNGDIFLGLGVPKLTLVDIPAPSFETASTLQFDLNGDNWVTVADINNDGFDDLVQLTDSTGAVNYVAGNSTGLDSTVQSFGTVDVQYDPLNQFGIHFGDFNDDGLLDVAEVHDKDVRVALSDGGSFTAPSHWGVLGFHDDPSRGNGWWVFATDADGDGIDDLVQLNEFGEVWIAISNGVDGFNAPVKNAALGFEHMPLGPWQAFIGNADDTVE